ncbi:hypothetical protein [Aphanothece microscopica]|uniref:hypothetical protein n=1 Tax=Aphanothece microscopica TaxID=1049561 RepID=UPI0039856306
MTPAPKGPHAQVEGYAALTSAQESARKRRNLALAIALAAFMALVFFITVTRIGGAILSRPF